MSSFVKKEWLFDKISGKTSTVRRRVKKVDWCKGDEYWVDDPGYCAKSTDNRRVSVTLDDT